VRTAFVQDRFSERAPAPTRDLRPGAGRPYNVDSMSIQFEYLWEEITIEPISRINKDPEQIVISVAKSPGRNAAKANALM
jgi:hypothetical protein